MYVIASLCILFSSANIFLISSVIFVISNSPFHFYYVVTFYTFSRDFRCLGRDSRKAELGFSTHFADFPCFGQRFPVGGAWFLYPFRRLSLFQVEISDRRGLVSLPISPAFPVLGRDFRTAEFVFSTHFAYFPLFRQRFPAGGAWFLYPFRQFSLFWVEISGRRNLGFSTHFAYFPLFRQRFPVGGNWFLYLFRRFSLFQVEIPGRQGLVSLPFPGKNSCLGRDSRHHPATTARPTTTSRPATAARPTTAHPATATRPTTAHPTTVHPTTTHPTTTSHPTTAHPTTAHPTTAHPRYGDTSRCSFSTHFIVIIIFYKGNN